MAEEWTWKPYYIHYLAVNAAKSIGAMKAIAQQKQDILAKSYIKAQGMEDKMISDLGGKGLDVSSIDGLLSGKVFEEALAKGIELEPTRKSFLVNKIEDLVKIKNNGKIDKFPEEISNLINRFSVLLEQYMKEKSLSSAFIETVIDNALAGKKEVPVSEVGQALLTQLMNATQREAFRVEKGNAVKARISLNNFIVALYALQMPGTQSAIKGKQATRIHSTRAKEDQDILFAITQLMNSWGNDIDSFLNEISSAKCLVRGLKVINNGNKKIKRITKRQAGTGSKKLEMSYKEDPLLEEYLNLVEGLDSSLKRQVNKEDFRLYISDDECTSVVNVTVKKSRFMQIENGIIKKGHFQVVGNTPLSSLLVRDAHFSGNMLHDFIQVGGAHGDASLDATFNDVIAYARNKAIYSLLIGSQTEDLAKNYILNINRTFVPISRVIRNLLSGSGSSYMSEVGKKIDDGVTVKSNGLIRSTYVNKNEWKGERYKRNTDLAVERSEEYRKEAMQLIYDTKVRIGINLKDLRLY